MSESPEPPDINAMLTTKEAAQWLKMAERTLLEKCSGRRPKIPAVRLNGNVLRFSPRMIIAKLADDAGVPVHVIAAAFGSNQPPTP